MNECGQVGEGGTERDAGPLWEGEGWLIWKAGSGKLGEVVPREEVEEGMGCHWCTSDKGRGRGSTDGK